MKKLIVLSVIVLFVGSALAYTYDGDLDPQNLFTYEPLFAEQLSPVTALLVVGKEMAVPRYAVVCVMRVHGGVIILAYAYYDADRNLKHFMMNQETKNYDEHPLDPAVPGEAELHKKLKELLDAFHGYSNC